MVKKRGVQCVELEFSENKNKKGCGFLQPLLCDIMICIGRSSGAKMIEVMGINNNDSSGVLINIFVINIGSDEIIRMVKKRGVQCVELEFCENKNKRGSRFLQPLFI